MDIIFTLLKIHLEKLEVILLFILLNFPLIIDYATQYLKFRESTNIIRFITGLISGFGGSIAILFIYHKLF